MTKFEDSFSEEVWRTTYKHHSDVTVDDTFRRVAKAIASVEKTPELRLEWEQKFLEMLEDFKVTAGGRIYSNAGTEFKGTSLLNCFVISVPKYDIDSIDGIMELLKYQTKTLKSEGGIGINLCIEFNEPILIKRNNEEMFIKIGEIKIGDYVLSDDNDWHIVEEIMIGKKENMIELELETGEKMICTDDHLFLSDDSRWIMAKDITENDNIVSL